MIEIGTNGVEDVLRDDLAQGDALIGTLGPILRHLLANDDHALFSDEIVARVRGMIEHLSVQLLYAQADAIGIEDRQGLVTERRDAFAESFFGHPALLGHCHALALEWQLIERLQARHDVDPVLSPLLQALIASNDAHTASLAMTTLAAQARFVQAQRRMELALSELPGDLFHTALITLRAQADETEDRAAAAAEAALRAKFDEGSSRLGLLARLVTGMGSGAIAALAIGHAGVAIFLTALAIGSAQDRDLAVLATNDRQLARLALALRAAGLKPQAVEEQFLYLHPDTSLPEGFEELRADRASALLSASAPTAAG